MSGNLNSSIRKLTNTFILCFLILSGVAAYIQVDGRAFFNGPVLSAAAYSPARTCPPYDSPVRGKIFDRNGNLIAESVPDSSYTCGYKRVYAQWVVDTGLAPLIGYFSFRYGASGIEQTYNDQLSNTGTGQTLSDARAKLLHLPRYGNDLYLTIDKNVQEAAARYYDSSAFHGGVCESTANPPGSITVEDPKTGEILAMVSFPAYDPNQIVQADSSVSTTATTGIQYWQSLNANGAVPRLLNRASQGLYDPGSTFKTVTLLAAIDSGKFALNSQFDFNQATNFQVPSGETIKWYDYFNGTWSGILDANSFPLTLQQGYAYSDNVIYARASVGVGAQTWLKYAGALGIATPSGNFASLQFDAPAATSTTFVTLANGQPEPFTNDLLAESGFGQGHLAISPLTMAGVASVVASGGYLYQPHVVRKVVPADQSVKAILPINDGIAIGGGPVVQASTAQDAQRAMASVVEQGTAYWGMVRNGQHIIDTGTYMGAKTGTGQLHVGNPQAWFLSYAPDLQEPGASSQSWGPFAVVVQKEHGGEGACQAFVANDIYPFLKTYPIPAA